MLHGSAATAAFPRRVHAVRNSCAIRCRCRRPRAVPTIRSRLAGRRLGRDPYSIRRRSVFDCRRIRCSSWYIRNCLVRLAPIRASLLELHSMVRSTRSTTTTSFSGGNIRQCYQHKRHREFGRWDQTREWCTRLSAAAEPEQLSAMMLPIFGSSSIFDGQLYVSSGAGTNTFRGREHGRHRTFRRPRARRRLALPV